MSIDSVPVAGLWMICLDGARKILSAMIFMENGVLESRRRTAASVPTDSD